MAFFGVEFIHSESEINKHLSSFRLFLAASFLTFFTLACTIHSQGTKSPAADSNAAANPVLLSKKDSSPKATNEKATEQIDLQALDDYKKTLVSHGERLEDQGILIESLDGKTRFAELNADTPFNPASVMKLATSLVALDKLTPDFRFRTSFLADGTMDLSGRKLVGDLVVEGGTDPMFSRSDAEQVAQALEKIGISRVTGSLRIVEPFYFFATGYKSNLSRETSAAKLYEALRRAGLRIEGGIKYGEGSGSVLVVHYSDTLTNILLYQNAHSSNAIAEVLGEALGGAEKIQEYLVQSLNLSESDLYVGRPSGLEFNRLTPRASLKLLRALIATLAKYSLKPENILPVAGVDTGTLKSRFAGDELRGSIIAKTGTLFTFDRGVSTLVGIAFTRSHGELLFAVFNSDGRVHAYRHLQDDLITRTVEELGGALPQTRIEDALEEKTSDAIVQTLYGKPVNSEPTQ